MNEHAAVHHHLAETEAHAITRAPRPRHLAPATPLTVCVRDLTRRTPPSGRRRATSMLAQLDQAVRDADYSVARMLVSPRGAR